MPHELRNVATEFFAALDALDADRMTQMLTEDVQSVDEGSRRWLRGRGDIVNYLRELMPAVSDVGTQLRDTEERIWGNRSTDLLDRPGLHDERHPASHLRSDHVDPPPRRRRLETGALAFDPSSRAGVDTPFLVRRRSRCRLQPLIKFQDAYETGRRRQALLHFVPFQCSIRVAALLSVVVEE